MKKLLFTLVALLTSVVGFAQTNLLVNATYSSGAGDTELSASSNWYASINDGNAWVAYTFTESTSFNQVVIACRDQVASSFTISYGESAESDLTSQAVTVNTDNDEAKATPPTTIDATYTNASGETANAITYTFDEVKSAKYIKIAITANFGSSDYATLNAVRLYNTNEAASIVVSGTDSWGFANATGTLNASTLSTLTSQNVIGIDLTEVTLDSSATFSDISFTNPNTLLLVNESDATAYATAGFTNVVYVTATSWLGAATNFTIDDSYAFYNGTTRTDNTNTGAGWIDSKGYTATYKRKVAANSWITFATPFTVYTENLPSGITAYTLTAYEDNAATLTKATVLDQYAPALMVNTTNSDITITVSGTGNFYQFNGNGNMTKTVGNISFNACLYPITDTTAGGKYGLQSSTYTDGQSTLTLKEIEGATIGVGRCYFTFSDAETAKSITLRVVDGDATGITNVEAAAADDAIYTLGGVRVKNATKGIYIKNGKKYIVK